MWCLAGFFITKWLAMLFINDHYQQHAEIKTIRSTILRFARRLEPPLGHFTSCTARLYMPEVNMNESLVEIKKTGEIIQKIRRCKQPHVRLLAIYDV